MNNKRYYRIATRLSVTVIGFTLIIFAAIMLLEYQHIKKINIHDTIENSHEKISNLAIRISGQLTEAEVALSNIAAIINGNKLPIKTLKHILQSIVQNNDIVYGSGIAFKNIDHSVYPDHLMVYVSQNSDSLNVQEITDRDYDYENAEWFTTPEQMGKGFWSDPYFDHEAGGRLMVTYSYPLNDEKGTFYAVITADVTLKNLAKIVDELKNDDYSFMLSRKGEYLAHPIVGKVLAKTIFESAELNKNEAFNTIGKDMIKGNTGTINFNAKNKLSYAIYTHIPKTGWSICSIISSESLLREVNRSAMIELIGFLVGCILLFSSIYFSIRKSLSPLEKFSESAKEIAIGNFSVELPKIECNNELMYLYNSFDYMQCSLVDYIEELKNTTAREERLNSELNIAHEIQMGMIPKQFPPFSDRKDIDLYAILDPARVVGGDLYDFFISDNKLYFIIGDVAGKGIPASLYMVITRILFRSAAAQSSSPREIVNSMNYSISEVNESNMFVTLFVGLIDLESKELTFCNAGHNPPIIVSNCQNDISFIKVTANLPIGLMPYYNYCEQKVVMESGAKLILYTDGISEAENKNTEQYTNERLIAAISQCKRKTAKETVLCIENSVKQFVDGAPQCDDLTIMAITLGQL